MTQRSSPGSDLLPCPFCGATPDLCKYPTGHCVECHECGGQTEVISGDGEVQRRWNRRTAAQAAPSDPYAKDVADWCQRSLDDARSNGHLETRPFVQNVELIISALRAYASPAARQGVPSREEIAKVIWHRYAPDHHTNWDEEMYRAEYLDAADAILALSRPQRPEEDK